VQGFVWFTVMSCIVGGIFHAAEPACAEDALRVFLKSRCADCHAGSSAERELDLVTLHLPAAESDSLRIWSLVYDRVAEHEMPPVDHDQPDSEERAAFLSSLAKSLTKADLARQAEHGRGVVRRLNRVEFENSLSDLLQVPLRIRDMLPPDAKGTGFDTVGEALNVSAVQMESYLQAIDVALDEATKLIERPPVKKWRLSYLQTHGMMEEYRRSGPHTPEPDGIAMFAPDFFSHMNSLLDIWVTPHSARYRVRVAARALRSTEPITMTVRMGGPGHKEDDEVPRKVLGHVSVNQAPVGEGQVFEFEDYLERGQMFRIYPSSLRKMRFEGPQWFLKQQDYEGPAIVVQWVEVEGPFYDAWPPASHRRLWDGVAMQPIPDVKPNADPNEHLDAPPTNPARPRLTKLPKSKSAKEPRNRNVYDPSQGIGGEMLYQRTRIKDPLHDTLRLVSLQPKQDAERLITSFAQAAFRGGPTDAAPYISLVHRWLDEGVDFRAAMRAGYKAVLVSPAFLYHQGGSTEPVLASHEIAERLAFFLWGSIPDAELLQADLNDPRVLHAQTERLLSDAKASRFIENFLGQWLDQRLLDFTAPDSDLYPEFSELMHWSIGEETRAFFCEMLQHDLSVRNVVDSDFAMLNNTLARHYGIPGVQGAQFQKVSLPADSVRGGVMTQASVLKVTANGTTTSPVVRGKWVLERIMGEPPDPPPPGVPAIEPDIRGAVTVQQQLEQHRSVSSCASCHGKIDPPGVALENFDVIGGWRTTYRAMKQDREADRIKYLPDAPPPILYSEGLPVNSADQLADGRAFQDIRDFKKLLLAKPDQIARTVTEKLVVYATGAPISFADRVEIEDMVADTEPNDHGFRSLIHAVVQSKLFKIR
jgi:hypothetical protein